MIQSTIFIGDLNIDCSIVINNNNDYLLRGYSANICAYISGVTSFKEDVVLDFSTAKKDIKTIIDNELDHRILLPNNENLISLLESLNLTINHAYDYYQYDIDTIMGLGSINTVIEKSLQKIFTRYESQNKISIKWEITSNIFTTPLGILELDKSFLLKTFNNKIDFIAIPFSYCHGLPHSSSIKCQMPLHGHNSVILAYIESLGVKKPKHYEKYIERLLIFIKREFTKTYTNNFYCVKQEYILNEEVKIKSDIGSNYQFDVSKNAIFSDMKICIFKNEVTIENITEEVVNNILATLNFKSSDNDLINNAIANLHGLVKIHFYISEGMKKGAIKVINI